jgi:hypothetical protein
MGFGHDIKYELGAMVLARDVAGETSEELEMQQLREQQE